MERASLVIRLELRLDGQSPIGRASTPGIGERGFAGWLGLIAAIEALAALDPESGVRHSAQPRTQEEMHDGTDR